MLNEATTLANIARLIGETLEGDYGVDPGPVYAELGIDTSKFLKPGTRISFARMNELWRKAVLLSNDAWFGFAVGKRARPGDFYALGHAWLASESLAGALQRLCRYGQVLTKQGSALTLDKDGETYVLTEDYAESAVTRHKAARDAGFVALLGLFDLVTSEPVRPRRMSLTIAPELKSERYAELFECPITYGADEDTWVFAADELERPLAGSVPDVADASDRIASDYVESLDRGTVATAVRSMLIQKLPSGRTDQESVAGLLHRSRSTLQRQLRAEGTSYKEILESTQQALAERYLAEGERSQAQIAFMTGFSDQSNFARAFKRWTGVSPGEYRKSATSA